MAACAALGVAGCSGGGGGGDSQPPPGGTVTLSGTITYDRVPFAPVDGNGLDYDATLAAPAREVVVELLQSNGSVLATTRTDTEGRYEVSAPASTQVRVRARAETRSDPTSTSGPSWDIQVLDNTDSDALWVLDGELFDTGAANGTPTRDLHAASGWGGTSYVGPRSAGPFALLDTLYSAVQFVLAQGDAALEFESLNVFWSPDNRPANGNASLGQISTTSFVSAPIPVSGFERGIYVLGDDGVDTDEYDEHVVAHEFGHFIEDTLGRSDSPGGPHGEGDRLDMRVAFSEGFSNAFSGMVLGDPGYRDSLGSRQLDENAFDMEDNLHRDAGWFSEGSVQSILWDLFDSDVGEANDRVALGFGPILDVLRNEIRTGLALTSVFPFIVAVKQQSGVDDAAVDALVTAQDIVALGMDPFGGTETNDGDIVPSSDALPVYTDASLNGGPVLLCGTRQAGMINKLGNRRFLTFNVPTERLVDIVVENIGPWQLTQRPDPDLVLWKSGFFAVSETADPDQERYNNTLPAGDYVLEIYEFSHVDPEGNSPERTCMSVTVTG